MTLCRSTVAISFVALAVFQPPSVSASICTTDEQTSIDNLYSELTNSSTCTDLISDSDASSLDYCSNNDCISELRTIVDKLPDCTGDDKIDRKTGLQAIVTQCANVTELMDQSPSSAGDTVTSGASRGALAAAAVITPLSVAFYIVMGLL